MQTQRVPYNVPQQGDWSFLPQETSNPHPTPTVVSAPLSANPQDHHVKFKLLRKHCHARNRAMWTHALVFFNVIGKPLSRVVHFEYNFTTNHSQSLSAWALVIAFQYLWLLSMPLLVGYMRAQTHGVNRFRYAYLVSVMLIFISQLVLQWKHTYVATLMLEGFGVSVALGILYALSILELSTHYRENIPMVSMQSGFAGFTGAIVYTIIGRQKFLLAGELDGTRIFEAGISMGTLVIAWLLTRTVKTLDGHRLINPHALEPIFPHRLKEILKEDGTIWFMLGSFCIFAGIFILPTFIVLLLARPPTLHEPPTAAIVAMVAFATSAISACIAANASFRRHLGPVETLIASTVVSAAACLLSAFMPAKFYAGIIVGAAYGVGLGAFAAIYIKTTTLFHEERGWSDDMPARAAIMLILGGFASFGSILGSAVILEKMEMGGRIVMIIASTELLVGATLIGVARWRRCRYWRIII